MKEFSPEDFIKKQTREIKNLIGKERALVAVSGGVDSVTTAVLTYKAVGENLLCVMLDDAFMREDEPEHIAKLVSRPPIKLPMKVLNVQERFLSALKGLSDAEEKRKVFRETFYKVLGETAEKEGCKILVQGTIKADVLETTAGVKTQHNVLEQIGINTVKHFGFKVVEPLKSLYKEEVRMVARNLRIPSEIAERQPFPGPGLSVRVVGEVTKDKLEAEKKSTSILERNFSKHKPSQYFTAIFDNETARYPRALAIQETVARLLNVPSRHVVMKVLEAKTTGVKAGQRRYGQVAALNIHTMSGDFHNPSIPTLVALQSKITSDPFFTRVFYCIKRTPQARPYIVALRAITTQDFLTASVCEIPWATLNQTADDVLKTCKNVCEVYFDVTPKPPATVEME
ncbi:MAG: GMP synthase [Candidatus Bathyarchaeota archaeon]|nr:GMP synthase [Candidatus Bathyarchaeota archaeon]